MDIPRIPDIDPNDQAALNKAFEQIAPEQIACCNWPEQFPYAPLGTFRMFHTGDYLLIRFDIEEEYTAALVTADNGEVWTDSCVEFFISLDDEKSYYNFETNCIGCMLLGWHPTGQRVEHAPAEVLASVMRTPSLGRQPFAERRGDNRWSLTLAIPPEALFGHALTDWSGVKARANLYKCGDKLSRPHFLSWRPVRTEKPDFHRPEFFETINFSKP